jgi:hypothetical protein
MIPRQAERPDRPCGGPPNELTDAAERDFLPGTPWHKHVPARIFRGQSRNAPLGDPQ